MCCVLLLYETMRHTSFDRVHTYLFRIVVAIDVWKPWSFGLHQEHSMPCLLFTSFIHCTALLCHTCACIFYSLSLRFDRYM